MRGTSGRGGFAHSFSVFAVPAALAGTVTFSFNGSDTSAAGSYTESASRHSISVTAYTDYGPGGYVGSSVGRVGSTGYTSLSIAFSLLDGGDSMKPWWGNTPNVNSALPLENSISNPSNNVLSNPLSISNFGGARYLIVVPNDNGLTLPGCSAISGNSCFRVDSITGTIPDPASCGLAGAALLMAAAARRRSAA